MGSKSGFAHALGAIAGIRAGEGAGAYVWAESDNDVRGLLRAYPDAEMLRRVAEIIRGWVDEEPRALWERLRAERKARIARGETVGAPEVAGWVLASMWSYEQGNVATGFVGPGQRRQDTSAAAAAACNKLAEYAWTARRSAHGNGVDYREPNETHRIEPTAPANAVEALAEFSTAPDRVAAEFEEVAAYTTQAWLSWKADVNDTFKATGGGGEHGQGPPKLGNIKMPDGGGWPPVYVSHRILPAPDLADLLGTPGDLEGVLCYSDPDYVGTTGYKDTYPRPAVVCDAIDRARMGARVMVSESVPVEELVALGWHATRIDFARKGQKRTFAKNAGEWVTSSFPPVDAYRAVEQMGMFG